MKPNPEQDRAVTATGSVAVAAGAGTGKTHMLARRYLHHVSVDGLSPLSIAAVTFTEKAAAELRSRIRKTLAEQSADEKAIAEVEAAQISTIHALAARICRDFYSTAGIPADFEILDETESPIWVAEKFEEAVRQIDGGLIREFGYTRLTNIIRRLLDDPYISEKALRSGSRNWRDLLAQIREDAIVELTNSPAWIEAAATLSHIQGPAGDKLEEARRVSVLAISEIKTGENIAAALLSLTKIQAHLGNAKAWAGEKERVAGILKPLKEKAKAVFDRATLDFTDEDEKVARQIRPLTEAFSTVLAFLKAEKLRYKVLDFNDLEHYALIALQSAEAVEHYRERWQAFLVDEFQDTNPIQAEIILRLTENARLTVVGDEKQSIYGFRGADPEIFGRVREALVSEKGGEEIVLKKTYRTHERLVSSMNSVFEMLLGGLHQPLEAEEEKKAVFSGPFIRLATVEDVKGAGKSRLFVLEGRYIAEKIRELNEKGTPFSDFAIISRTWEPLEVYLDVLSAAGIPAVHAGGGSLLNTREAWDVFALFSFLVEPLDDVPLVALLRSPFFGISDRVLFEASQSLERGIRWWQLIQSRPEFSRQAEILNHLLRLKNSKTAEEILAIADALTGYKAAIANLPYGERREADFRGVEELLRKLARRGRGDVFGTARYFYELIESKTDISRPLLDAGDAVSLMTIHKAKGLEWPVVFVPDLARQRKSNSDSVMVDPEIGVSFSDEDDNYEKLKPSIFQLIRMKTSERETAEFRRVLYVALTRAEDMLFLTATSSTGCLLDLLRPGLESAGVLEEIIPFNEKLSIPPPPGERAAFDVPVSINVEPVRIGPGEVTATSLSSYARCPLQFKYMFVDGHPGLSEGAASARAIGILTHRALQYGITEEESLKKMAWEYADEQIREAISLACRFGSDTAFAEVRRVPFRPEVGFLLNTDKVRVTGVADFVADDFVLDYKTDSEIEPAEHRFQLWAYAQGFEKKKAAIAYLRHNALHWFDSADLQEIGSDADRLLTGIRNADYRPDPSVKKCTRCPYVPICSASLAVKSHDESGEAKL